MSKRNAALLLLMLLACRAAHAQQTTFADVHSNLVTAHAVYSFAVDGGAIATITPAANASIPANAILVSATINSTTAVTSAGSATVAVGVSNTGGSTNSLLAATAKSSFSSNAVLNGATTFTPPLKVTSVGNITLTVATAALTAGVVEVWVQYYVAAN